MDALHGALGKVKLDSRSGQNGKALYRAYSAARLPQLRQELPGLKLSQYQERIFDEWKVSPENPRNQRRATSGDDAGDWDVDIEDGDYGDA